VPERRDFTIFPAGSETDGEQPIGSFHGAPIHRVLCHANLRETRIDIDEGPALRQVVLGPPTPQRYCGDNEQVRRTTHIWELIRMASGNLGIGPQNPAVAKTKLAQPRIQQCGWNGKVLGPFVFFKVPDLVAHAPIFEVINLMTQITKTKETEGLPAPDHPWCTVAMFPA